MCNRALIAGLAMMLATMFAGCAAQLPKPDQSASTPAIRPASAPVTATAAGETYTVSEQEAALDCGKLTGRMHIRIAHMRDASNRGGVSALSRNMQSVVTPVLGGTKYGLDPARQARRDRAQLAAYNNLLEAKGCKQVDIEAELAKTE